ncbi:MAG: hypothetical protein SFW35_12050 [Chitinophagales bacterium]|nr:hypothetical protein [Chitinophagales bacterium]
MKAGFYIISLFTLSFLFSSCDDACSTSDCGPYKECFNGECLCPQGFEGDACDIYSYEKYIGTYQVSENCTSTVTPANPPYTIYVTPGNQVDRIVLNNMSNLGLAVEAVINGNFLQIPAQTIGAYTIEGSGEYNSYTDRVTINFNVTQGSNYSGCTAICSPI